MGIAKLSNLISDAFKDERGAGKTLAILGTGSLVAGYLFTSIALANIKEHERQAHYFNAGQMAEGIKFKIGEQVKSLASTTKSPVNILASLPGTDTFSIEVLTGDELNALTSSPDPTKSRTSNTDTDYDEAKSKVKVVFQDADGDMDASDTTAADIGDTEYRVNLISSDGHAYIAMFVSADDGVDSINTNYGSVTSILDGAFELGKDWVPLAAE